MKKIFILQLVFILLMLFSCNSKQTKEVDEDNPSIKEDEEEDEKIESKINIQENAYILRFSNDYLDIVIDKSNGSINQFMNKVTGKDYIENSYGGNFSLEIDTSTNNPFETDVNENKIYTLSSRSFKPVITYELNKDLEITLDYNLQVNDIDVLKVTQKIILKEEGKDISTTYHIENGLSIDSVVTRFTGLIVSGIKDSKQELSLLYPHHEGKIYSNAIYLGLTGQLCVNAQYPSPMSMQLMELFDDNEALYYFVKDTTREYKTLNFGDFTSSFDKELESTEDKVSLSVTQYPYVVNGASKDTFETVIGVESLDSWYQGADLYREFLISNNMNRNYNDFVKRWTGTITTTIASYGDAFVSSYNGNNNPAVMVESAGIYYVDTIMIMGWHQGGFDSKYPDYDYYEGENFGGRDGFIEMINNAHENGDKIIPYINGYMCCQDSNWGLTVASNGHTNLENNCVKTKGYSSSASNYLNYSLSSNYYQYGNSTFYFMCPKSQGFQEELINTVKDLVSCGVDGLWIDQLLEMPAYLCYDESHGHTNPATAYGEGYKEMLEAFNKAFTDYGKTDYLIFSEGITDAYMEWIDIAGLNWGRNLYALRDGIPMQPQVTEYTLPEKQLGISGTSNRVHAYAFLFASPFIDGNNAKDYECTKVYLKNPEIYFDGRYLDKRYINVDNENIKYSLILASDSSSAGIQLYNNSTSNQEVIITIDIEGLNKKIVSAINMFNGNIYAVIDNKISLSLDADEITSIKLILCEDDTK